MELDIYNKLTTIEGKLDKLINEKKVKTDSIRGNLISIIDIVEKLKTTNWGFLCQPFFRELDMISSLSNEIKRIIDDAATKRN